MNSKLFIFISILIISCNTAEENPKQEPKGNTSDVFTKVYNSEKLEAQSFVFSNSTGEIITGYYGTILKIRKNTFVDENGKPIDGDIELELKEVFTPKDRVLGNLTTTYENKPLETGGMLFIDATSNGNQIYIAENKSILVSMPTDSVMEGMSLFTGIKNENGIKWVEPEPLQKPSEDSVKKLLFSFEKTTNIWFSVDGFEFKDIPAKVNNFVSDVAWAGEGVKIQKDSVINFEGYTIRFSPGKITTWSETFEVQDGKNSYVEDMNTCYIFSLKKLGWANIDRLINDPRTEEVELITKVKNGGEYKLVYLTMVTQNMYLPGYKMKNGTYSFAHDDEEQQQLPVGENATLIATAYVDGKPYFALKKIQIKKEENVELELKPSTEKKMRALLEQNLD